MTGEGFISGAFVYQEEADEEEEEEEMEDEEMGDDELEDEEMENEEEEEEEVEVEGNIPPCEARLALDNVLVVFYSRIAPNAPRRTQT